MPAARSTKTKPAAKRAPTGKAAKRPAKAARKAPAPRNTVKAARGPTVPPPLPLRTVTPALTIEGASAAIAWYKKNLGAKELTRVPLPDGKLMHAAIEIGDSILMLADSFGPAPPQMMGVTLHIHAPTIDKLWANAMANGATVVMPLANQFWGDRYGQLRDPFGHTWSLGWPAKMTEAEKARLQKEAMQMFASAQHPGPGA